MFMGTDFGRLNLATVHFALRRLRKREYGSTEPHFNVAQDYLHLYGAYRVKSGAWCRVSSSISWPEARSSLRDGPRGARHQARTSRHRLVFGGPGGSRP